MRGNLVFIAAACVPVYLITIAILLAAVPGNLPPIVYVLLPLIPLIIFIWWIMRRSESPYG